MLQVPWQTTSFASAVSLRGRVAGAGVGSEDSGSRGSLQWRGVCESEEHADGPEQQLLQRIPQQ